MTLVRPGSSARLPDSRRLRIQSQCPPILSTFLTLQRFEEGQDPSSIAAGKEPVYESDEGRFAAVTKHRLVESKRSPVMHEPPASSKSP